MERNLLLATFLSVGVMLVWMWYVMPLISPPKKPLLQEEQDVKVTEQPDAPPEEESDPARDLEEKTTEHVKVAGRVPPDLPLQNEILCRTNTLLAEFTSRGAALRKLTLLDFSSTPGKSATDSPLELVVPVSGDELSLVIEDLEATPDRKLPLSEANWRVTGPSPGENDTIELVFELPFENYLQFKKTFRFRKSGYCIWLLIEVLNASPEKVTFHGSLRGPTGIHGDGNLPQNITSVRGEIEGEHVKGVQSSSFEDVRKTADMTLVFPEKEFSYVGITNKYFTVLLKGISPTAFSASFRALTPSDAVKTIASQRARSLKRELTDDEIQELKKSLAKNVSPIVTLPPLELAPGEKRSFEFLFYAGPKKASELKEHGRMVDVVGIYGIIGICRDILNFFYGFVGNYGVAIIFLTILVRIVMHPLSRKQMRSMAKYGEMMAKLQPLLMDLQKKYQNNLQKLRQEQMRLFKEYGVNPIPLGGCLPMILQIPIYIGLWSALDTAIELRHAEFLWIKDLSRTDQLFQLPYPLPILGTTDFNLLPVLMILAMWANSKLMPQRATDPQSLKQQRIMMTIMYILFGLIFYNFASGLVLYILVSTILGVGEYYLVNIVGGKPRAQSSVAKK